MPTVKIQKEYYDSREADAIRYSNAIIVDHHADGNVGSVEYIESLLGEGVEPNYYPEWTKSAWYREIGIDNVSSDKVFIKPSDAYKRFDAFETYKFLTETIDKYEPVIASSVVCFVDEWRYYIADGKILCSWWYDGSDATCENNPHGPSELPFDIPEDFCGAIDMGYLDTGEFALVEVQLQKQFKIINRLNNN